MSAWARTAISSASNNVRLRAPIPLHSNAQRRPLPLFPEHIRVQPELAIGNFLVDTVYHVAEVREACIGLFERAEVTQRRLASSRMTIARNNRCNAGEIQQL